MNEWIIIGIIVIGTIYIVVVCIYLLVQISNDAIYKRKRKRYRRSKEGSKGTYRKTSYLLIRRKANARLHKVRPYRN